MRNASRRFMLPALFLAGVLTGSAITLPAIAYYQPNMRAALTNLNSAYNQLSTADADKGGYRVRAMNDVTDAIRNVKLGIRYANGRR
jgi:hypothetical protein